MNRLSSKSYLHNMREALRRKPLGKLIVARAATLLISAHAHLLVAQTTSGPYLDESKLPDDKKSLTEVNKELTNPISSIWSITLQENNYWVNMPTGHADRTVINTQFQPVLPVSLTDNWNLINRPVIPAEFEPVHKLQEW